MPCIGITFLTFPPYWSYIKLGFSHETLITYTVIHKQIWNFESLKIKVSHSPSVEATI